MVPCGYGKGLEGTLKAGEGGEDVGNCLSPLLTERAWASLAALSPHSVGSNQHTKIYINIFLF